MTRGDICRVSPLYVGPDLLTGRFHRNLPDVGTEVQPDQIRLTPAVSRALGKLLADGTCPASSLIAYVGCCIDRACIRARYSPMMPRENSCAPEKMAMI